MPFFLVLQAEYGEMNIMVSYNDFFCSDAAMKSRIVEGRITFNFIFFQVEGGRKLSGFLGSYSTSLQRF